MGHFHTLHIINIAQATIRSNVRDEIFFETQIVLIYENKSANRARTHAYSCVCHISLPYDLTGFRKEHAGYLSVVRGVKGSSWCTGI